MFSNWSNAQQTSIIADDSILCNGQSVTLRAPIYTQGSGVQDIDGNQYSSVIIGSQEWMSENLKVTKFSNGDIIANITSAAQWYNFSSPAWCNYENNTINNTIYGKLYNQYVAIDNRNVCPSGWHVPTSLEWYQLSTFLGGTNAGGMIKSKGTLQNATGLWETPNSGANNLSDFNAHPAGMRYGNLGNTGSFVHPLTGIPTISRITLFWTSYIQPQFPDPNAAPNSTYTAAGLYHDNIGTNFTNSVYNSDGISIRCLKNTTTSSPSYLWNTGDTTAFINVTPNQSTWYFCQYNLNGVQFYDSIYIQVIQPFSNITTNQPTTVCEGNSIQLNATSYSGSIYQWIKDGVPLIGQNNNTIIIGQLSTESGTYSVTSTYLGCVFQSNSINITIHPTNFNPSFSSNQQLFTAPPFAVQFTNSTANSSNYTFTWYWGDGTSTVSSNPTVFHQYLTNGLYTVTLEAMNNVTGCTDQTTLTDYIFTTGGLSCTHSAIINQAGPITACLGQSVVLSCNSNPTFTYQWRKNGVYISGNNNDSLIVTQPGTYSVIISDNGCPVSSGNVLVNFSAIATPQISSNGTIQPCVGGSVTLNATPGYSTYLWSNGATSASTTINSSGSYTVQVTNATGCSAVSNPFVVNASILPIQNICVVGVDSASNNLRVVWEKPITTAIDSFFIFKETNVSNVYLKVGGRHYDSLSVWIDQVSNPAVQAYRYKITALDTCGTETPLSDFHKSIHLTINQGVGGAWNLIWSHYEGINYGSYNIYRGTSPNSMSLLTSIQSNLNSYTDLTPPTGNVYYQIEIVNPNNCNPTKQMNYSSARSNIVTNASGGIEEVANNVRLYPNPAQESVTLESEISFERYRIVDCLGREVLFGEFEGKSTVISINQLLNGQYFVEIPELNQSIRFIKN